MPGAVARTATQALDSVTLPYMVALAEKGWQQALADKPGFADELNISGGKFAIPQSLRRWLKPVEAATFNCPKRRNQQVTLRQLIRP